MIDRKKLLDYNYNPNEDNYDMVFISNHFYIQKKYLDNEENYKKLEYNLKNTLLKLFHNKLYNNFDYEELIFVIVDYDDYSNWKAELCTDNEKFTTNKEYNIVCNNSCISFNK